MPAQPVSDRRYPSGHDNPGVEALIFILEDWTVALEQGGAIHRLPDPAYVRPSGKAPWTEEELDTIVRNIDAEIGREVTTTPGTSVGAQAGPELHRLAYPQRRALAQQLEQTIEAHRESLREYFPASAPWRAPDA